MTSFRGAPTDALVRAGADRAIVRAQVLVDDRRLLIEIELARGRPNRVQVNKQRVQRRADLVGLVPVTVFGPDDLELIKGGPVCAVTTSTICSCSCIPRTRAPAPRSSGCSNNATRCCVRRTGA
jgi:hypothetical protein